MLLGLMSLALALGTVASLPLLSCTDPATLAISHYCLSKLAQAAVRLLCTCCCS